MKFENAQQAFCYYYEILNSKNCLKIENTNAILNQGFYLLNPLDNEILIDWRKWNKSYSEYEWEWYLSQNRSVEQIKKRAKIWDKMHSGDNIVNSNYGWQWNRNFQIDKIIEKLKSNKNTRQAVLTIYDGKEIDSYKHDTPCTLNILFNVIENKLNMTVMMRSNDLWFGFCNDQYCFSKLQQLVAESISIEIGWYYHFANNLHIYEKQIGLNGN